MKRSLVPILCLLSLASSTALAQFTPGRVVVLRCAATSTSGNDGILAEYLPPSAPGATNQAAPMYTVTLPNSGTTDSGSSIVFGQNSAFNHVLSLSADGALIVIPGYGNKLSSGAIDTTAGANRVVATVKYNGTYARPLGSTTFTTTAFRSAASDGFGNFCGNAGAGGFYLNTGASLAGGTLRAMAVANGTLYFSTGTDLRAYNGGFPTSASPGFSTVLLNHAASPSGTGFSVPTNIVVGSRIYMADVSVTPGTVQRWDWDGGTWVWQYDLTMPAGFTPQHLATDYSGANPVIFVTTAATTAANRLYAFTDTGSSSTAFLIASNAAGLVFRGVVLAPTQPALPSFTTQPSNSTNNYGATATFGPVSAAGANPNAWSWLKGNVLLTNGPSGTGSTVSGATTTTLSVANITGSDAGTYYAVASNNGGSVTSGPAILALAGSSLTTQLKSRTNAAGTIATFHVVSGGPPPLTYAWTFGVTPLSDGPSPSGSGATISGSSTDTLTITGVQDADAGDYTVTVSDSTPADSSSTATLTVVDPPNITTQPANQNKVLGATASFFVTADGGALFYRWLRGVVTLTNGPSGNGSTISGATSSNLVIANVQLGDAGVSLYTAIVTNVAGAVTSSPAASLTVGQIPTVSFSNQTNWPGSNVTFSAIVTGTAPLFYVWKHDGAALNNDGHFNNVDTSALSITPISTDDARRYTLTVSNSYGSTSVDGYLFVQIAAPETNNIPGLILYDKFNYPVQPYPGFPAPAGWVNNWEYIISAFNQVSGRAAYWVREGNAYSTIEAGFLRDPSQSTSGQYPWPGVDCSSQNQWYWSSAPNNNHLKFGGVNQTNGAAYFSCILHITQGSALNQGVADVIAGFTSGDSVNGGANVDTWNCTLGTLADNGGDGYYLGIFKGVSPPLNSSSANGEWAYGKHLARGQIHFIVGCYKFVSGGTTTNDDTVSLWIDPPVSAFGALETNRPPPDAGGMKTNWAANAAITEFALRGSVAPASKRMTDLRIGTTWASVTGPYYPNLKIASTPPDVTLTWPTKDSGYIIEESPTLTPPAWFTNSLPPYAVDGTGTNNTVTVPGASGDYFRLIYPPR